MQDRAGFAARASQDSVSRLTVFLLVHGPGPACVIGFRRNRGISRMFGVLRSDRKQYNITLPKTNQQDTVEARDYNRAQRRLENADLVGAFGFLHRLLA